ncbi:MAG: TfoX/Sxy family DNA transformation protein [Gammaproteobacteria bacterium]|nr:TfoX/Sxy family DNA transformation protein [Gammaproteobacteria bacterium]
MGELAKLRGLGKKTEQQLNAIGIYTQMDLQKMGAIISTILFILLLKMVLCQIGRTAFVLFIRPNGCT